MALKCFAMFSVFPLIKPVIRAAAASSFCEARLGFEEFGEKVHLYAVAYREEEFQDIAQYASHIIFNSFSEWDRYKPMVREMGTSFQCGIRINPEYSEVKREIYDSCRPFSRLGVTKAEFQEDRLSGISGFHIHSHTQNNSDTLERTIEALERNFGHLLKKMKWVNFGGGQQITDGNYDVERLCQIIRKVKDKYNIQVYLEPGESVGLNAGFLVATVRDIIRNDINIAILDTSATAHMPLVVEEPYTPRVTGADAPDIYPHVYQLGGCSCVASDIIGTYSFPNKLSVGDKIVIEDMLPYTMVRNTTFNGICLPTIATFSKGDGLKFVKRFGYNDYKSRLS